MNGMNGDDLWCEWLSTHMVGSSTERPSEFFCERARRELSYTFFPVEFVPGSTDDHFEPLSTKWRLLVATMTILC